MRGLLREVREALPSSKRLSLAAYPPPVPVVGNLEVHWTPEYIRKLSQHVDQMVFMNYDSGLKSEKLYMALQSRWIGQILESTQGTEVLIGLPAYEDAWAPWHDPDVEHLRSSLAGLHAGLQAHSRPPSHYRGVSLYSDWEMEESEWQHLRIHFLRSSRTGLKPKKE